LSVLFIITTISFDAWFFYIRNFAFYPLDPQKISTFRLCILPIITSAHPHTRTSAFYHRLKLDQALLRVTRQFANKQTRGRSVDRQVVDWIFLIDEFVEVT